MRPSGSPNPTTTSRTILPRRFRTATRCRRSRVRCVRGRNQGVGGDERERGPRAGADVHGADLHAQPTVLAQSDRCLRTRIDHVWVGGARHAESDERVPLAPTPGRPRPRLPAESVGALPQAVDQPARPPRFAAFGVDGRIVADPQLDRIDPTASASSSIATSPAYIPGASPGRASSTAPGRRVPRLGARCADAAPCTSTATGPPSARRTPWCANSASTHRAPAR